MVKLSGFAAFIFDLDGLILDTEPTYFAAWQLTVETMGFQLPSERYLTMSGYHYQRVMSTLQEWLGSSFDLAEFDHLSVQIWRDYVRENGITVKPGVVDLLDYANRQRIPYCVATNSMEQYAKECLAIAGLTERFPLLVTRSDVERAKPSPEIFLKAAELMGMAIDHCVIFEDSHTGVVAAAKSGAYTVYVPSSFPINPATVELADCLLDDLTQALNTCT
ncbi:MAG: HAD family phosphatase [Gammaproteobacteria bacterium]|nr:HAD family phosphatase [Gammaproteobacteria bacterium]